MLYILLHIISVVEELFYFAFMHARLTVIESKVA